MLLIQRIMQPYVIMEGQSKVSEPSRNPAPKLLQRQIASVAACSLGKAWRC